MSYTGYTFTPCVGYFTSPGIDTKQKGPPAFSVSSERHRHVWGERNCRKLRNGGWWDWNTVRSIDSPALYRATTAPHVSEPTQWTPPRQLVIPPWVVESHEYSLLTCLFTVFIFCIRGWRDFTQDEMTTTVNGAYFVWMVVTERRHCMYMYTLNNYVCIMAI